VVILLVAVVGGASTVILVSALRGSDRANSVNKIRASGNYAITQIAKMIRYAKEFNGVGTDGVNFSTDALSCPSVNPPPFHYLKITSFDNGSTVFSCIDSAQPVAGEISSNSANLVDTADTFTVSSCRITCTRENNGPFIINIDFKLNLKSDSFFYEKQASIPFHASVATRNY